ncbi:hypothetical protein HPB47_018467 [Ixodes persulcatus]|uniref:Uncharacterized protein n=1 Tax=Ixodes persulcatus TaxID=34615 RepID=A0AC60QZV6_IXOPE|nr:hypothetical protein HPB47_018467 [Ixodes persulcatus]
MPESKPLECGCYREMGRKLTDLQLRSHIETSASAQQPAPTPDPPQLPTINNELPSAGQEESVEECPTELPEPHVEADSLYLPSDASFLMMMSDTGFPRDAQQNTACGSALSQHESSKSIDYVSERKFIVFESCLDELLGNCPECTALCRITEKKIKGTCLRVHRMCNNGHQHTWTSQPSVNRRALGDVLLAAATLYSGSIVKKVLRLLRQMGFPVYRTRHTLRFRVPSFYQRSDRCGTGNKTSSSSKQVDKNWSSLVMGGQTPPGTQRNMERIPSSTCQRKRFSMWKQCR